MNKIVLPVLSLFLLGCETSISDNSNQIEHQTFNMLIADTMVQK